VVKEDLQTVYPVSWSTYDDTKEPFLGNDDHNWPALDNHAYWADF
jgi:hypothetical protein